MKSILIKNLPIAFTLSAIFIMVFCSFSLNMAYFNSTKKGGDEFLDTKCIKFVDAIAIDGEGCPIVTGQMGMISGDYFNIFTIKYSTEGEFQWYKLFDSPGSGSNSNDRSYNVISDSDNNIYVTGESADQPIIIKYSPTGDSLWQDQPDFYGRYSSCAINSDNNIYAAIGNGRLIKYDFQGNILWTLENNGSGISNFDFDENQNVFIHGPRNESSEDELPHYIWCSSSLDIIENGCGYTIPNLYTYDFDSIEVDCLCDCLFQPVFYCEEYYSCIVNECGINLQIDTPDSDLTQRNYSTLKISPKGDIIWGNFSDASLLKTIGSDVYLFTIFTTVTGERIKGEITKLDIDGKVSWRREEDKAYWWDAFYVIDSDVIAIGNYSSFTYSSYYWERIIATKFDKDGNEMWWLEYPENNEDIDYSYRNSVSDSMGNIYVNAAYYTNKWHAVFLKIDYNGNLLWTKESDKNCGHTNSISIGPNENSFFTACSVYEEEKYIGITTIKYDSDGNILWERIFDGKGICYGSDDNNDDSETCGCGCS